MKITAWRITRKQYVNKAFSGEGAKSFGGRWNPVGYPMVYVAQNLSLAILELIVHLDEDSDITSFVAIPVTFDRSLVHILPQSQLPKNWFDLPISEQSQVVIDYSCRVPGTSYYCFNAIYAHMQDNPVDEHK